MKKLIIGIALISMFLLPAGAQFATGAGEQIQVQEVGGVITVATEYMTVKVVPNQAHLMWWYGNRSESDEMYKVQLVKIQEFSGDDDVLDNKTELTGTAYNLVTLTWVSDIVEEDDQLTITLGADLPNGAHMSLIMHVYTIDTPINGTDQVTDALTELKFDIVVDGWDFTPTAQGFAIQTYCTEVQHRHRVEVRNGTVAENGNTTRTMQFTSDEYGNEPVAYMEWTEFADVYNSTDDLIDTITVGQAYFDDLISPPTEAPGFAEGLGHLFLTYPNYGDDNKLVHDPTIGLNADAFTSGFPVYLFPVVGGLFTLSAIALIISKKKK